MTMKMILMTMKMATIAKLDSGRCFKAVQCPLQPDKDSELRSNKDEDDCDKCFSCCPRKTLEPSVQARISHNQFISLCVKAPCWLQEKYKNSTHRNAIPLVNTNQPTFLHETYLLSRKTAQNVAKKSVTKKGKAANRIIRS